MSVMECSHLVAARFGLRGLAQNKARYRICLPSIYQSPVSKKTSRRFRPAKVDHV